MTLACKFCTGLEIERVRNVTASGASQVFDLCLKCGKNSNGTAMYLPRKITGAPEQFRVIADYRLSGEKCAVCGEAGTEDHHFAPRHIFGVEEAELWPRSYLCVKHHKEWHNRIMAHARSCELCRRLYS